MSAAPNHERPLSPHLQIYRWQLTMIMSILHRITGAGLVAGTLLLAWLLIAAALGDGAYNVAHAFITSPLGLLMIFGWSVAFYYHLLNGVRHLIWDMGYLLSLKEAYASGYIVLLMTVLATAATWYCAYNGVDL